MKFARLSFVFVLVFCLIVAQNNLLIAQTSLPNSLATSNYVKDTPMSSDRGVSTGIVTYTGPESLGAVSFRIPSETKLMPPSSVSNILLASNTLPAPLPVVPPAPTSSPLPAAGSGASNHIPVIVGLAMVGVGVGLLVHTEPVHQTVCITYGICPVPGATHVAGGILIGVGAPLAIAKLIKH